MAGLDAANAMRLLHAQMAADVLGSLTDASYARAQAEAERRAYERFLDEIAAVREVCRRYVEHAGATYRATYPVQRVVRRRPELETVEWGKPSAAAREIVRMWVDGLREIRVAH